jgi:hypothetical protein
VVSAFRVKYRRGGIFNITTVYLLLLVAGGVVLQYYNQYIGGSWPRNYLIAILGLQFIVSGIMALSATSSSLRSEVVNRTLDFQRIAALTPGQILFGKILGEPALAYLLAIATVPLSVWCWTLGVEGVSFGVLILFYVNLATHTLLVATMGLQQNLETTPGKTLRSSGGGSGLLLIGFAYISCTAFLAVPWFKALAGLLTPVPLFQGLLPGQPLQQHLSFFGLPMPFLIATPLAQLGVAYLCFRSMVRRLLNPLNTALSKGLAYAVLILVDLAVAGVLCEPIPLGLTLVPRAAAFCLVHLTAAIFLTFAVTPGRESLRSWVWRFRGRSLALVDSWLGQRSENGLALITMCAVGMLAFALFVVLPAGLQEGWGAIQGSGRSMVEILLVTAVLVLSLGSLYQWFAYVAGPGGAGAYLTVVPMLVVPIHLIGHYYDNDWLLSLSPSAHFVNWFSGAAALAIAPVVAVYGLIFVVMRFVLRRRLRQLETAVDNKLKHMGCSSAGRLR